MAVEDSTSEAVTPRVDAEKARYAVGGDEENSGSEIEREIIKHRNEAYNRWLNAEEAAIIDRSISKSQICSLFRTNVEVYLSQAIPLLTRPEIDSEVIEHILKHQQLGEIVFEPPQELVGYAKKNLTRLPPNSTIPTRRVVNITGLLEMNALSPPISQQWTVAVQQRSGLTTKSASRTKEIPTQILKTTMQLTDRALAEIDVGPDLEKVDGAAEAQFDYSDLEPEESS